MGSKNGHWKTMRSRGNKAWPELSFSGKKKSNEGDTAAVSCNEKDRCSMWEGFDSEFERLKKDIYGI